MFIKDRGSLIFWGSLRKDDKLSDIIDISLQTINQRSIIYSRTFFLLTEKMIVISKIYKALFMSVAKINVYIFCLKKISA